ncbi:MAG: hypothetical protein ACREIA_16570 [Opitutaceae bacterium]
MRTAFPAQLAVLPVLAVALDGSGAVAETSVEAKAGEISQEGWFNQLDDAQSVECLLEIQTVGQQWSNALEKRFSRLTALKAAGIISAEDKAEWLQLRSLRRASKNPIPADEILFQYRRRRAEQRLLAEFEAYVRFLDSPHRSQA